MPARLIQVTLRNKSKYTLRWRDDHREHGFWQDPWYPSNLKTLKPGEEGTFRQESGGVMTGVRGEVAFTVDANWASLGDVFDPAEELAFYWRLPYLGAPYIPLYPAIVKRNYHPGLPLLTYALTTSVNNMITRENIFSQGAASVALGAVWVPFFFVPGLNPEHISFEVELYNIADKRVRNTTQALSPQPPYAAGEAVIYAIKDNGDLLWSRHEGRDDGSLAWAAGSGTRVGTGWNFKQVFSGGDGVIYAIQNTTIDMTTGQRIGGNLAWYRHDGWRTGGLEWTAAKTAGRDWDKFKQVFYGGDGVIYAIQNTTIDMTTGQRIGGQLLWYRHDGQTDGSATWAQDSGKTVGTKWDYVEVFSG